MPRLILLIACFVFSTSLFGQFQFNLIPYEEDLNANPPRYTFRFIEGVQTKLVASKNDPNNMEDVGSVPGNATVTTAPYFDNAEILVKDNNQPQYQNNDMDSIELTWTPNTLGLFPDIDPNIDMPWTISHSIQGQNYEAEIFIEVVALSTVPTLSQWGVVLFILLMLSLGLVTMLNLNTAMVQSNGTLAKTKFQIPFDWSMIKTAFPTALAFGLLGLVIVWIGWGEVIPDDVIGLSLCVILLTYLIQVMNHFKK